MDFDRDTLDGLYQYCLMLCGERDRAYDLLYGAIERFLAKGPEEASYPVAYIRRIARNAYFDQLRRERVLSFESLPESDHDSLMASPDRTTESRVLDQVTLEKLWQTLAAPEREVLYFWAVQGMTATEIGLHLEQPRSSILSRLRRVRLRLNQGIPATGSGGSHE